MKQLTDNQRKELVNVLRGLVNYLEDTAAETPKPKDQSTKEREDKHKHLYGKNIEVIPDTANTDPNYWEELLKQQGLGDIERTYNRGTDYEYCYILPQRFAGKEVLSLEQHAENHGIEDIPADFTNVYDDSNVKHQLDAIMLLSIPPYIVKLANKKLVQGKLSRKEGSKLGQYVRSLTTKRMSGYERLRQKAIAKLQRDIAPDMRKIDKLWDSITIAR